jgi:hypothetical protein
MSKLKKYDIDRVDIEVFVNFVEPSSPEDEAEREDRILSILCQSSIRIAKKGVKNDKSK